MIKRRNSGFVSSSVCLIIFCVCSVFMYWILEFSTEWTLLKISEYKELGNLATYDLKSDLCSSIYSSSSTIQKFNEDIMINGNRLFLEEDNIFIEKGVTNE